MPWRFSNRKQVKFSLPEPHLKITSECIFLYYGNFPKAFSKGNISGNWDLGAYLTEDFLSNILLKRYWQYPEIRNENLSLRLKSLKTTVQKNRIKWDIHVAAICRRLFKGEIELRTSMYLRLIIHEIERKYTKFKRFFISQFPWVFEERSSLLMKVESRDIKVLNTDRNQKKIRKIFEGIVSAIELYFSNSPVYLPNSLFRQKIKIGGNSFSIRFYGCRLEFLEKALFLSSQLLVKEKL